MRIRTFFQFAMMTLLATGMYAQAADAKIASASTGNTASIVGVWRADMDGLPYVTLNITDEGGGLAGAVLFYLHRRDPGKPMTSTVGAPEPMLNPTFDGRTLRFRVSHRHAHPPRTSQDPPVTFRLSITGDNSLELFRGDDQGAGLVLTRSGD